MLCYRCSHRRRIRDRLRSQPEAVEAHHVVHWSLVCSSDHSMMRMSSAPDLKQIPHSPTTENSTSVIYTLHNVSNKYATFIFE